MKAFAHWRPGYGWMLFEDRSMRSTLSTGTPALNRLWCDIGKWNQDYRDGLK